MSGAPFACATAARRIIAANGLQLHALEWPGSRPPLLLLHGGSAHAHWFDAVVPLLEGRFHLVSLDQRGHGESQWPTPPAYRTEDFVADILAVADALGWERFSLVGHSMGGHNALAFAAGHPERLSALVLADSRPTIPADRLRLLQQRGWRPLRRHPTREAGQAAFRLLPRETTAAPALLAHLAAAGLAERDGGWVFRFDPAASAHRQPVDGWGLLGQVRTPTLVVRAARSGVLPAEMAEKMRTGITAAELVEIPGAYHHVTLDAPGPFAQALLRFLALQGLAS